jgi:hypothetical protein
MIASSHSMVERGSGKGMLAALDVRIATQLAQQGSWRVNPPFGWKNRTWP